MKTKLSVDWIDEMAFKSQVGESEVIIDADRKVGGKGRGPQPKPLMLLSLVGCTGMDVISILKKMRVTLEDFKVSVEAEHTEEHPRHYSEMKVIYEFWGKDLPEEKIKKAVNLSEERYCGVSHVYKKAIPMATEIKIHKK